MTDLASVGVATLAALAHATLQISLGSLLLLYHASLGKHVRIKTRRLASNYILGAGLMVALLLASSCFIISVCTKGVLPVSGLMILVGVLVALALCAWLFYYKSGRSTELWLPRSVVRFVDKRAKTTNSNVEAFALGLLTSIAELPFALILVVVAANAILLLPQFWQVVAIICYTVIALLPLIILRTCVRRGKTVADIQRWRTRNKNFFRFLLGIEFLVLALFLVAFEVMGR